MRAVARITATRQRAQRQFWIQNHAPAGKKMMIDFTRLQLMLFYCDRCGALYLFQNYDIAETALATPCRVCGAGILHSISEVEA